MNKKRIDYSLVLIVFFMGFISCGSENTYYDKEQWTNALKTGRVMDRKPEKLGSLDQVYKQISLRAIDEKYIYISSIDDQSINIYSREDLQLKKKFGGKGEGPGEFRMLQGVKVYKDYIIANSPGKNSYFSKTGGLIKEVKCPPQFIPCYPLGDNFITKEYSMPTEKDLNKGYSVTKIVLLNSDYKSKKILFQKTLNNYFIYDPQTGQPIAELFPDQASFKIYKDNIYIGLSSIEGFFFYVFDHDGNKLHEIKRPYIKKKIPGILKQAIQKKDQSTLVSNRKVKIKFYEYFPSFCSFTVSDDKIYVFLYPEIHYQRILVLDLKGKLLQVNLIPFDIKLLETSSWRILTKNFVFNGKKYYFRENDTTNKLELWSQQVWMEPDTK